MDLQIDSKAATKLIIHMSALSLALSASFFSFLLHTNRLYDLGKLNSSILLLLLLPALELLKHFYAKRAFQLDGTVQTGPAGSVNMPTMGRTHSSKTAGRLQVLKELYHSIVLLASTVLFYSFICTVLGAPVQEYEETICLALTMTTLTVFPMLLLLGQAKTYSFLLSESVVLRCPRSHSYFNHLKQNCIGVLLGAWSASVVAPLDWDRPWQVYPIPNYVGCIIGQFGMSVYNLLNTMYIRLYRDRHSKIV
uniref:Putative ethanolamine-p-transferase gpi11/pig-f n=1 Tax=Anopheles marajoara TaxID=58244 RepID=A0A2M4BXQ3_9DIPT